MKEKLLNRKDKDKLSDTKQMEKTSVNEATAKITKKESSIFQIANFQQYNALMKLRIAVSSIFFLCTISMILIFVGGWMISAVLLLIGYVLLFILMVKLFRTKKL